MQDVDRQATDFLAFLVGDEDGVVMVLRFRLSLWREGEQKPFPCLAVDLARERKEPTTLHGYISLHSR